MVQWTHHHVGRRFGSRWRVWGVTPGLEILHTNRSLTGQQASAGGDAADFSPRGTEHIVNSLNYGDTRSLDGRRNMRCVLCWRVCCMNQKKDLAAVVAHP